MATKSIEMNIEIKDKKAIDIIVDALLSEIPKVEKKKSKYKFLTAKDMNAGK